MDDIYAELLQKTAAGDQLAFKELYEQCSPKLMSLCLRLLRTESLAEDVLQEGFIKIWDKAGTYTPSKGKAMTWMATVIRNKGLDKLRSLKTAPSETDIEYEGIEFASTDMAPDTLENMSQDLQGLMACLDRLKPDQKECILLSYYYGHSHQELSDKLGKPLGTIKAWIRRGLEDLRPCLS
jgi:RNA polymerase sigma-70 factor (ECF subfamily)